LCLIDLCINVRSEAAIVSTVHDEIIVECPAELAESVKQIVTDAMCSAMQELYPEVPIEVEAHDGVTWAEAK